ADIEKSLGLADPSAKEIDQLVRDDWMKLQDFKGVCKSKNHWFAFNDLSKLAFSQYDSKEHKAVHTGDSFDMTVDEYAALALNPELKMTTSDAPCVPGHCPTELDGGGYSEGAYYFSAGEARLNKFIEILESDDEIEGISKERRAELVEYLGKTKEEYGYDESIWDILFDKEMVPQYLMWGTLVGIFGASLVYHILGYHKIAKKQLEIANKQLEISTRMMGSLLGRKGEMDNIMGEVKLEKVLATDRGEASRVQKDRFKKDGKFERIYIDTADVVRQTLEAARGTIARYNNIVEVGFSNSGKTASVELGVAQVAVVVDEVVKRLPEDWKNMEREVLKVAVGELAEPYVQTMTDGVEGKSKKIFAKNLRQNIVDSIAFLKTRGWDGMDVLIIDTGKVFSHGMLVDRRNAVIHGIVEQIEARAEKTNRQQVVMWEESQITHSSEGAAKRGSGANILKTLVEGPVMVSHIFVTTPEEFAETLAEDPAIITRGRPIFNPEKLPFEQIEVLRLESQKKFETGIKHIEDAAYKAIYVLAQEALPTGSISASADMFYQGILDTAASENVTKITFKYVLKVFKMDRFGGGKEVYLTRANLEAAIKYETERMNGRNDAWRSFTDALRKQQIGRAMEIKVEINFNPKPTWYELQANLAVAAERGNTPNPAQVKVAGRRPAKARVVVAGQAKVPRKPAAKSRLARRPQYDRELRELAARASVWTREDLRRFTERLNEVEGLSGVQKLTPDSIREGLLRKDRRIVDLVGRHSAEGAKAVAAIKNSFQKQLRDHLPKEDGSGGKGRRKGFRGK
ncbi:hypothetical protein KKA47_01990, partial [bacterium]|nr:hypothetical protein [bacterium]